MNGILNVLKPPEMTSHDVVGYLRNIFKIKRIGHTGTLDPGAAGVLPICIGKATKVVDILTEKIKEYNAQLILGTTTDTQDSYGKILTKNPVNLSKTDIDNAVKTFIGKIKQVPPMYSAVKIGGRKLYEYARNGLTIERPIREVEIFNIRVIDYDLENYSIILNVTCSKGTYVRTLCSDIGDVLGCGGHMGYLIRTKTGHFSIESSYTLDEIYDNYNNGDINKILIPIENVFSNLLSITIKPEAVKWVMNGAEIFEKDIIEYKNHNNSTRLRVYSAEGNFLGIYKVSGTKPKAFKVDKLFI